MILSNKTAIFILSYNRKDNNITYKTLQDYNITTPIYVVVGDDDPDLDGYKEKYKDRLVVFSKKEIRPIVDMCDNFGKTKCVVYARNAIFKIAKELGIDYFCVLDDDYKRFSYRRPFGDVLKGFQVKDLQYCINASFNYLMKTPNLDCFAWCQEGDFIGGAASFDGIGCKRKIMNCFFFKTDVPIRFMGSINEDLSASVYEGQRGKCFFTINDVSVQQEITQKSGGGLTDVYLDLGTYLKSFYSVIVAPNCVKISAMGSRDLRIHHKVNWNKASPKIIRQEYKK